MSLRLIRGTTFFDGKAWMLEGEHYDGTLRAIKGGETNQDRTERTEVRFSLWNVGFPWEVRATHANQAALPEGAEYLFRKLWDEWAPLVRADWQEQQTAKAQEDRERFERQEQERQAQESAKLEEEERREVERQTRIARLVLEALRLDLKGGGE